MTRKEDRMRRPRGLSVLIWTSFAICASLVCTSWASFGQLRRDYVFVNLPGAPVQITAFGQAKYEEENRIKSVVQYRNVTTRAIEAAEITMIYFNPFNDKEAGVRGITTDLLGPGQEEVGSWSVYGTPSLVKTAMAFVSAVRFADNGEVWRTDVAALEKAAAALPILGFLTGVESLTVDEKP
jgi:hypothetical protein